MCDSCNNKTINNSETQPHKWYYYTADGGIIEVNATPSYIKTMIEQFRNLNSRTISKDEPEDFECEIDCQDCMNNDCEMKRTVVMPKIWKVVHFNRIVTKVYWTDQTTTTVKLAETDEFNEQVGIAMCIAKKFAGSYEEFYKIAKRAKFKYD